MVVVDYYYLDLVWSAYLIPDVTLSLLVWP